MKICRTTFLLMSLLCTFPVLAENRLYEESELSMTQIDTGNPEKLEVQPKEFTLTGSRQRLQLVVTGFYADGQIADLTRAAQFQVATPTLAEVNNRGTVVPRANGQTTIRVTAGNVSTTMTLNITNAHEPENVSFRYQTLPILSKAGCSMGACHGSPHGKGGFRLSLRAFDPALDYESIVKEKLGRRVNLLEPEQSLLIAKPRNAIAHGGGQRFRKDDPAQTLLIDWIRQGCRADDSAPPCTGIHVTPGNSRFLRRPHHMQQLRVTADFADGSTRDITHLTVFESSDETVCRVSRHGLAVGIRRGEVAVIVRYLQHIESVVLGFVEDVPDFAWNAPPSKNYVDDHIYSRLKEFQYAPSQPCSDETFLRRVSLDLTGLLPSLERTRQFLGDETPDRRARLIDELLQSDEHAAFWSQKWGDLLRLSTRQMGHSGVLKFHRWIQQAVSRNLPYDEFAREILLASGSTLSTPAGNFYRTGADTSDIMESTAQLFLGTRIGCAKCHNHPYERWTQDNYYGLSAFFNRIATRQTGRGDEAVVWMRREGEVSHPVSGKPVSPWVPAADTVEPRNSADRRKAFTDWLTAPENPFFAKVEVNRICSYLLGRGIVEPFDDHRDTNPPANGPLLDALAADFVKHDFDRRHIIRTILNSQTYQTSATTNRFNHDDTRFFSHYLPRRLTAEQLIDALGELTGIPEQFASVHPSTKATQLPAPDLKPHDRAKIGEIEFLKVFGMPERQSVCECERGSDPGLGQALEMFNGETVHRMLSSKQNRFHRSLAADTPHEQIVRELYLRAFARQPNDRELQITLAYLKKTDNPGDAFEDIVWALVNQNEFLFQH